MIVITQNTTNMFKQELENCNSHSDSWRCIIFNFSTINQKPENWLSLVLDTVSTCLGEEGTRAFCFENGNIFFLLKFATQRAFLKVTEILSNKIKCDLSSVSSLYEVKIDIALIKQHIQEVQASIPLYQGPVDQLSLESEQNYNGLLSSLSYRRREREKYNILIIEDDPFSLRLVQKALGNSFSLHMAEDGASGFESYIVNAPDVLFLDIGLPDTNGLQLMERILKADPHAYIIILSGNGNKENVLKAVQIGARGFVGKPFTREKLFHYIEKSPFINKLLKVF